MIFQVEQDLIQSEAETAYHSVSIVKSINEALRLRQEDNRKGKGDNTFTFFIRSTAQLEDPDVLRDLVAQKEDIVAPLLETYADDQIWRSWSEVIGK